MKKYKYTLGTKVDNKDIAFDNTPMWLKHAGIITALKNVYKGETNNDW